MRATSVLLLVLLAACGRGARDTEIRRARLAAEKRNLAESFDRLEDRLLTNQARVRLWREMKDRHESVSAIACASQDEHAAEIASRSLDGHSSLHRARVAAAAPGEAAPSRAPADP